MKIQTKSVKKPGGFEHQGTLTPSRDRGIKAGEPSKQLTQSEFNT